MDFYCRKPNRLKDYDYGSIGGYFLTICSAKRKCIFWNEKEWNQKKWQDAKLSQLGEIVDEEIRKWDKTYSNVRIDKYVIMPNHIHIIVIISPPVGENFVLPFEKTEISVGENSVLPSTNLIESAERRMQFAPTIPRMVKQFKGAISKQTGESIWQKSFYDHVIRGEKDYERIWEYIETNPYGCIDVDYDWV